MNQDQLIERIAALMAAQYSEQHGGCSERTLGFLRSDAAEEVAIWAEGHPSAWVALATAG